jgi:osmoprotectant transport system ATP-binding protein
MLELRQVSKRLGTQVVVPPLDLVVPAGQTTVLLGPSGCGKSTLLRLFLGLLWPDTGTVHIGGELLTPGNALRIRQQLGYMVQDGGLFPHLSAADNVTLVARYLGWPSARLRPRLTELADLTRLPTEWLARYPVQLSGGQRQRVALMRALMLDPAVILLDEPLGALDPLIRSELQTDLRQAFTTLGKTVLLVTHDLAEAGFLGDRLVLLRAGQIEQAGTLAELVQQPASEFVTRFINAQRPPAELVQR